MPRRSHRRRLRLRCTCPTLSVDNRVPRRSHRRRLRLNGNSLTFEKSCKSLTLTRIRLLAEFWHWAPGEVSCAPPAFPWATHRRTTERGRLRASQGDPPEDRFASTANFLPGDRSADPVHRKEPQQANSGCEFQGGYRPPSACLFSSIGQPGFLCDREVSARLLWESVLRPHSARR